MNSKELMFICILVIAIVAIGGFYIVTQKSTEICIANSDKIYDDDFIILYLVSDEKPLVNQSMEFTLIHSNGDQDDFNLITDDNGAILFSLSEFEPGNYTLKCHYGGNYPYASSNKEFSFVIIEKVAEVVDSSSSQLPDSETIKYWTTEDFVADGWSYKDFDGDRVFCKKFGEVYWMAADPGLGYYKYIGNGDRPYQHGFHG